ncbi:MAG: hypothetical protein HONBIEJF_00488 [Fimbriimonadaceae bacterium]|nr:hypothetical protein [Fimbriimonadaceae bacterium]
MTWTLYYDGGCNLCHVSRLQAEDWAHRAGQPLNVDVLQGGAAIEKGYGEAMVLEAEKVYIGADAWLKLLTIAPWYLRWVGLLGKLPVFREILKLGYGIVAKYRKKWFGSRACALPSQPKKG